MNDEKQESVTLRDQFAMAALTGLVGSKHLEDMDLTGADRSRLTADASFFLADAMLKQREQK